ncbi:hypothetical protein FIBSPDRAFT_941672 [Athelia psychrophila]|uniref:Ubiquitin 3 binding protein But2 C-terminal domain-containing protein n=1 Tax=Athelia psychrophila TaxID=1759441 RepID=A0A167TNP7_9AGAM|nr:hypothetical protein FIBSPDRAFT_941672 [Fibularhizoctonia sp. CBS 109695]
MGLEHLQPIPDDERLLHLTNFPIIMTQINRTQPALVSPDDSTRRLTRIGGVSPDARRFAVSNEVSTIAQFRAVDYGLENCSLQFSLQLPLGAEGLDVGNNASTSTVDVWLLDAPMKLDVARLSWDKRPKRRQLFETMRMPWGSAESGGRSFACPWNSMQSFEFACSTDGQDCQLDFWQDPKRPYLGVTMRQSSSLV